MAVILSDNMALFGSKKPCSSKNEDHFLDACSIPIAKVQSSLLVAFLRPALSDMTELCILLNQLCPSFCKGYSPK